MPENEKDWSETEKVPTFERLWLKAYKVIDGPATFFREQIVNKLRREGDYYYYHRQYRRVPNVDQCGTDDAVCQFEADQQFRRDKLVDGEVLKILRQRKIECMLWYGEDHREKCTRIRADYDEGAKNFFIKYGDLGVNSTVKDGYMKQKHRLIYERRNPEWAAKQGLPAQGRPQVADSDTIES